MYLSLCSAENQTPLLVLPQHPVPGALQTLRMIHQARQYWWLDEADLGDLLQLEIVPSHHVYIKTTNHVSFQQIVYKCKFVLKCSIHMFTTTVNKFSA